MSHKRITVDIYDGKEGGLYSVTGTDGKAYQCDEVARAVGLVRNLLYQDHLRRIEEAQTEIEPAAHTFFSSLA